MLEKRTFPFTDSINTIIRTQKLAKREMVPTPIWTNAARSSFAVSFGSRFNDEKRATVNNSFSQAAQNFVEWCNEGYHSIMYQSPQFVVGSAWLPSAHSTLFHSHKYTSVALCVGPDSVFKNESLHPPKYSLDSSQYHQKLLKTGDCFIQYSHSSIQPYIHRGHALKNPLGFIHFEYREKPISQYFRAPNIVCTDSIFANFIQKVSTEFCSAGNLTIANNQIAHLHIDDFATYLPLCRIISGVDYNTDHVQVNVANGVSCHRAITKHHDKVFEVLVIQNITSFQDVRITVKNTRDQVWNGFILDFYGTSSVKRET